MDLTQLSWAPILTLVGGGLGGAIFTAILTTVRSRTVSQRVTAALRADLRRARSISEHNARVASFEDDHSPRAFIRYPTQTYELLLFNAPTAALVALSVLDSLMDYLQQAYHVNSMIQMVNDFDLHHPATTNNDISQKKRNYLAGIKSYSSEGVSQALAELEKALIIAK